MARKTKSDLIQEFIQANRENQVAIDKMDEAGAAALGINRTDQRCLDVIDQAGRITAGRLAEEAGLATGSVTAALDRLEAKGYVRRLADPADRRRVIVELTERARERGQAIWGPLGERGMPHLMALSGEELRLLIRHMRFSSELNARRAEEVKAELE